MPANPNHAPQVASERAAWVEPKLNRLPVSHAEFGGGPAVDGDSSPS